jgi:hypothetical protein
MREVPVVQASSTREFPEALDRVQLRAVGREVIEGETIGVLLPPLPVRWYLALSVMTTTRRPLRVLATFRYWRNFQHVRALNLSVSRRKHNLPSRKRTAPKYPTLRRVG